MTLRDILEKYTSVVPPEELKGRVEKFQKALEADCALLVHSPDIYYYSGSKQEGFFVIPKIVLPSFWF